MAGSGFQQLGNKQERSCLWAPGKTHHQSHQQVVSCAPVFFCTPELGRFSHATVAEFNSPVAHLGTDAAANWWVETHGFPMWLVLFRDNPTRWSCRKSRQCLEKTKVPTCSNTRITISQIKCWKYYSLQSFYHQVTPLLVSVVSEHWQCWK